jgi:aldose 1-epimerase
MSTNISVIKDETFGVHDGVVVNKWTISNQSGLSLTCVDYGATVISVMAPNRSGVSEEVSLNYKTMDDLVSKYGPHFGCLAGRYANRIAAGKFEIDGVVTQLNLNNNGINHLHGGRYGFDTKVWNSREIRSDSEAGVEFTYFSPDGDEKYPGNLEVLCIILHTQQFPTVLIF